MVKTAVSVCDLLKAQGTYATLVNVRFVSPVDNEILNELSKDHSIFITMEENVRTGGYGQQVSDYICKYNLGTRHINFSIPDYFIEQGGVEELYEKLELDAQSITRRILKEL